jgi:hypothetical protein
MRATRKAQAAQFAAIAQYSGRGVLSTAALSERLAGYSSCCYQSQAKFLSVGEKDN